MRIKKYKNKKTNLPGTPEGVLLYPDHKLVTRRDFLSSGMITMSATMLSSPLIDLVLRTNAAMAADCSAGSTTPSTMPAFIQINLSGGAGLVANSLSTTQSGELPTDLSLCGLGGRSLLLASPDGIRANALERRLGLDWFFQSGALAGIDSISNSATITDPNAKAFASKTQGLEIVGASGDDTDRNMFCISGMVAAANLYGLYFPPLNTGGTFGQADAVLPRPAGINVQGFDSVLAALGFPGAVGNAGNGFNRANQARLAALFETLGAIQSSNLAVRNKQQVVDVLACSHGTLKSNAENPLPGNADPRQIDVVRQVFGIAANTAQNNINVTRATVVVNALVGNCGPASIELGSYDYHNNTRATGDGRDRDAGILIGQILATAAGLGRKVYVMVVSDGGVRSEQSLTSFATAWTSDRGQSGKALCFMYDPAGKPAVAHATHPAQVGYFTDNGQNGVNPDVGVWAPAQMAMAGFINYLSFALGGPSNAMAAYNTLVATKNAVKVMPDVDLLSTIRATGGVG